MPAFAAHPSFRAVRRLPWASAFIVALFVLLAPRVLFGALSPLDGIRPPLVDASVDRSEYADQNFPGSAYFFVEGAFDPAPSAAPSTDPHIYSIDPGAAAPAYAFRAASGLDSLRAQTCLTQAIYYEAANEPDEGQRAVAQVVLNRVRHPAWPNSVCGVVYQDSQRTDMKCQFTFTCDGALMRRPSAVAWARASRVAMAALSGAVFAPVGLATHYHTLAVRPFWSSSLKVVGVIGAHIFYRLPGDTPAALSDRYAGREASPPPYVPRAVAAPVFNAMTPIPQAPAFAPYAGVPQSGDPLPAAQPRARDGWSSALPESTIRPEFRNSGRPLI